MLDNPGVVSATVLPLSTTLAGVSVTVNGVAAPILAVWLGIRQMEGGGLLAILGRRRPGQTGHRPTSVIRPQHEGAQRRVANHAERARVDLDPLDQIKVHAQAVCDH